MLNGRARTASSKAASAASHRFRSMKTCAGYRIGTEEDRIERWSGPVSGGPPHCIKLLAALPPGCVVKDLDLPFPRRASGR